MQFVALHRAQKLSKAHLPTEPASYAAVAASQAGGCAPHGLYLRVACAHEQIISKRIRMSRSTVWPSSSRCTSREYTYGMPRAVSGVGSRFGTAASCICHVVLVIQLVNAGKMWGLLTTRAAIEVAIGVIRRPAPCAKAFQGPFTHGTGELCSSSRLASRRVCPARFLSPGGVCT